MLPTAIAPIYEASPMCPTMAISTSPNSGTVMFETIEGSAMSSMSLFLLSMIKINRTGLSTVLYAKFLLL